jgi:hypothetical protein
LLVAFGLVVHFIDVYFNLHSQDLDLLSGDFYLVGLAVEREAIDWIFVWWSVWRSVKLGLRGPDEGKLDIGI